jgi:hypothetical protein
VVYGKQKIDVQSDQTLTFAYSYYMYFHSITTALFFISVFASIELVFAAVAWKGFGENLWNTLSQILVDHEKQSSIIDDDSVDNPDELSVSGSSSDKSD